MKLKVSSQDDTALIHNNRSLRTGRRRFVIHLVPYIHRTPPPSPLALALTPRRCLTNQSSPKTGIPSAPPPTQPPSSSLSQKPPATSGACAHRGALWCVASFRFRHNCQRPSLAGNINPRRLWCESDGKHLPRIQRAPLLFTPLDSPSVPSNFARP